MISYIYRIRADILLYFTILGQSKGIRERSGRPFSNETYLIIATGVFKF